MQSLCPSRQRLKFPVGSSSSLVHVTEGRYQVLPNPWVISIVHTVLLANLPNGGGNVRIPSRTHSWEQVMLHLEIETTSKVAGNSTAIGRGCLHLRLEPADGFSSLTELSARITVRILKVVRQGEEQTEGNTFTDAHQKDDSSGSHGEAIVRQGRVNIQEHVHNPQGNCILSPLHNVVILLLNSDVLRTPVTQINDLRIEYGRQPVESKQENEVCSLELVPPLSLRMSRWVIVECKHGLRAKAIRIFFMMIGECMMSPML